MTKEELNFDLTAKKKKKKKTVLTRWRMMELQKKLIIEKNKI